MIKPSMVLAGLPGCGRRPIFRLEAFQRTAASAFGELDFDLHVCAEHLAQAEQAIREAGYTPHRMLPGVVRACGHGFDFTTMTTRYAPELAHPEWCDQARCTGRHESAATTIAAHTMTVAVRIAQPRNPAPGPVVVVIERHADGAEPVMLVLPPSMAGQLGEVLVHAADDAAGGAR